MVNNIYSTGKKKKKSLENITKLNNNQNKKTLKKYLLKNII